jgi:hypothetical protein
VLVRRWRIEEGEKRRGCEKGSLKEEGGEKRCGRFLVSTPEER